jgi:hypothetical protein
MNPPIIFPGRLKRAMRRHEEMNDVAITQEVQFQLPVDVVDQVIDIV